jgi:hypothetical protein
MLSLYTQESKQSCICVLGVSILSLYTQESEQSCICVLGVSILSLYIQESEQSCICMLGVSILSLYTQESKQSCMCVRSYQCCLCILRRVNSHVYVWTKKYYNSLFRHKYLIDSANSYVPRLYHNKYTKRWTLKTFDVMGPHQVFIYKLLTFKLLKLYRKHVVLLCDILMLYL